MPDRDPVDDVIRRSVDVEIPADVEAGMRRQFTEFAARLGHERRPLREGVASLVARPRWRWALGGVALATVLAVVFVWGGGDGSGVYAAAVSRLAAARSVQYTIEIAPFVSVEFSHLAPARGRVNTSWGIEIRSDGAGAQLVLLHGTRQYVREQKAPGSLVPTADLVEQLQSLPRSADTRLGERTLAGRRVVGYRVQGSRMAGGHGVESLDLWLDARTGAPDHVDITPVGAGTSGYQMHIRDIRVDADLDAARFSMTPPAGYSAATASAAGTAPANPPAALAPVQPTITRAAPQTVIVIRMSGSYLQAASAADRVAGYLRARGVAPSGAAFGRFESEARWEVGYPVPAGTAAEPPFELETLEGGTVASMVLGGPWGQDSAQRWPQLISWLDAHGYIIAGPPTEAWKGDASRPESQATEMRIAIAPK
jgi:hypothetical protein